MSFSTTPVGTLRLCGRNGVFPDGGGVALWRPGDGDLLLLDLCLVAAIIITPRAPPPVTVSS